MSRLFVCGDICNSMSEMKKSFISDELVEVIKSVDYTNNEVVSFMVRKGVRTVGGTTLIVALIKNDMLYWISIGDSHIYLFSDTGLKQLNEDHIYAPSFSDPPGELDNLGLNIQPPCARHEQRLGHLAILAAAGAFMYQLRAGLPVLRHRGPPGQ